MLTEVLTCLVSGALWGAILFAKTDVCLQALRKTFITNLSKSGVSPKMARSLARHSDINLTMNVYTDVVLEDQAVAVELLPELPPLVPATEPAKGSGILQHVAKMREKAARKSFNQL